MNRFLAAESGKQPMIEYRRIKGQFNRMAVCSGCGKDALQTRITGFCQAAMTGAALLCDRCSHAIPSS